MINKLLTGLIASLIVVILPVCLFHTDAIETLKPWLLLCMGMLASMTQPAYKPLDSNATAEDRGTAKQLVWTVYLILIAGVCESMTLRYPESMQWNVVSVIFIIIAFMGAIFRAWSVAVLGVYFTWHIKIQSGQKIITNGPYKFVRHPSYTGAWILYIFILLFINAWIAATLMGILLLLAFNRRMKYEEIKLIETFGDDYIKYSKKVKKIIPFIW